METYILGDDPIGKKTLQLLIDAAKRFPPFDLMPSALPVSHICLYVLLLEDAMLSCCLIMSDQRKRHTILCGNSRKLEAKSSPSILS